MDIAGFEAPSVVTVGGVRVDAGGYWKSDGAGGITQDGASESAYTVFYDTDHYELTLNGAQITKPDGSGCGISADGGLKIKLIGDNTVDLSQTPKQGYDSAAIQASKYTGGFGVGALYIYGDSSDGADSGTFIGGNVAAGGKSYGLCANSTIDISNATVTVRAGSAAAIGMGVDYNSSNPNSGGRVIIDRNAAVTAESDYIGIWGKVNIYNGAQSLTVRARTQALYLPDPEVAYDAVGYAATAGTKRDGSDAGPYDYKSNDTYQYYQIRKAAKLGAAIKAGPSFEACTHFSMTVHAPEIQGENPGNQTFEYAIVAIGNLADDLNPPTKGWQTSPTFMGLEASAYYRIWARTAAKGEYGAGAPQSNGKFATAGRPYSEYGLFVNGVAVNNNEYFGYNTGDILASKETGNYASFDPDTRTLTLHGTLTLNQGYVDNAVGSKDMAVIYSRSKDLNIVIADGTTSIELDASAYDYECRGIYVRGNLTIQNNSEGKSGLNVNVKGKAVANGIESTYKLTILDNSANGSINVTADAKKARGLYGWQGINLTCNMLSAVSRGSGYNLGNAAIATYRATDTINIYSGTITARLPNAPTLYSNDRVIVGALNYPASEYRMTTSRNGDGSTLDSPANLNSGYCKYVLLTPGEPKPLAGTLTLSGTPMVGWAIRANIEAVTNLLGTPVYQWYRVSDTGVETRIESDTGNYHTCVEADLGQQIKCTLTTSIQTGDGLTSAPSSKITAGFLTSLYVNGAQITGENAENILGDATKSVAYDILGNTLSLRNAAITYHADSPIAVNDSQSTEPLTIYLEGENSISTNSTAAAILAMGVDLIFTGPGSLTIETAKASSSGIIYAKNITVTGDCAVDVTCTTVTGGSAIYATGSLTVCGNGKLNAAANSTSDVTSSTPTIAAPTVSIAEHATVEARAAGGRAIDATTIEVTGGSVTATNTGCQDGGITTNYSAMRAKSKLTVSDGTVSATSTYGYGIEVKPENGAYTAVCTVSGGAIQTTSEKNRGLSVSGSLTISGGDVHVTSTDYQACFVKPALTVSGGTFTAASQNQYALALYNASSTATKTNIALGEGYTVYADTAYDGSGKQAAENSAGTYGSASKYVELVPPAPPKAPTVLTAAVSQGVVTYTVSADEATIGTAVVAVARFDAEGKMQAIQIQRIDLGAVPEAPPTATFVNAAETDTYKVFLLGEDSYGPLCGAVQAIQAYFM